MQVKLFLTYFLNLKHLPSSSKNKLVHLFKFLKQPGESYLYCSCSEGGKDGSDWCYRCHSKRDYILGGVNLNLFPLSASTLPVCLPSDNRIYIFLLKQNRDKFKFKNFCSHWSWKEGFNGKWDEEHSFIKNLTKAY